MSLGTGSDLICPQEVTVVATYYGGDDSRDGDDEDDDDHDSELDDWGWL